MAKIYTSVFFFFLFFFVFLAVQYEASHLRTSQHLQNLGTSHPTKQPYRTAYHFQPPKNWMNDPNGPLVYKGIYHLFYQWNPKGAVWGNIVWAHSTSTDLVNWIPHVPAIYPSQTSDIKGCWSGSTTILPGNKPAILYTGINPQNQQVQNLATPKNLSDPFLREWVKSSANPLMAPSTNNQINASSFRDPTTAWKGRDGKWRVIIGSKLDRTGLAIMYKSDDFVKWTQTSKPLHSAKNTGMWECPDFFPVPKVGSLGVDTPVNGPKVKHVLKLSFDDTKHDYYTIGTYNIGKDIYIPDKNSVESSSGLRYDYGKFYASKTFYDSLENRRVLWGWVNESSTETDDINKGWSGLQAIPRKIWLDKDGKQLIQWPIKEIETLRAKQVSYSGFSLKGGSVLKVHGVNAKQADVEVSFSVKASDLKKAEVMDEKRSDPQMLCSHKGASVKGGVGPFGLLVLASKGLKEYTGVFFRVFKSHKLTNKFVVLMCSDQSRSSLNEDNDKTTYGAFVDVDPLYEDLSLRSLIDHSVVESFGANGKACITARIYPKLAIGSHARLYAFNNGTQNVRMNLKAWNMKKANIG